MNGLRELLREREDAIVGRWLDDTLAAYPEEGARAFARERNRFANPVGHSLREGLRAIYQALVDGNDDEAIRHSLDDILQIRAVQQIPPTTAVGFLFHLKELLRTDFGGGERLRADLEALNRRIDQAALVAFELYVAHRERVYELRLNEVKRTIPWMVGRVS
jgi:RsbT co-antagonist protein rsbRD N-terminal domain